MTLAPGAATVAVMVTLWLGIYGHKWFAAEKDEDAAKARAAAATKAAWKARRVLLGVVFVVYAAFHVWTHGRGR